MTTDSTPTLFQAMDTLAVAQLVLSERESRDMGWWVRMADCFHPDSRVRLSWIDGSGREFVQGSIDMARRGLNAKHRLGPAVVRIRGDRAVATLSAIIDIPAVVGGVEAQLSSYARFLYRVERRDAQWRIAFFDVIYVRDELVSTMPGQVVPVSPQDVAAYRKSYRMMCHVLSLKGYVPSQRLAGDDLPDTAATMTAEAFGWAGLEPDAALYGSQDNSPGAR